jgi:hypothetical protein
MDWIYTIKHCKTCNRDPESFNKLWTISITLCTQYDTYQQLLGVDTYLPLMDPLYQFHLLPSETI